MGGADPFRSVCMCALRRKGDVTFRSDNISTISVLKEVLSKEATQKKIAIKTTHGTYMYMHARTCNAHAFDMHVTWYSPAELNDATIAHVLGVIFPKLEGQLMLAKNVQLIEALQEIKVHEEDTSFLSPQCQFILGQCALVGWLLCCIYISVWSLCRQCHRHAGRAETAAMLDRETLWYD